MDPARFSPFRHTNRKRAESSHPASASDHRPPEWKSSIQRQQLCAPTLVFPFSFAHSLPIVSFLNQAARRSSLLIVVSRLIRGLWLLTAISIFALSVPVQGEVTHVHTTKSDCCAHQPEHHGHCNREPVKSPERPCCSSCVVCLPLINVPRVAYIFGRTDGEKFATLIVNQRSRSARPPVPPPRV